eukprot:g14335.t1
MPRLTNKPKPRLGNKRKATRRSAKATARIQAVSVTAVVYKSHEWPKSMPSWVTFVRGPVTKNPDEGGSLFASSTKNKQHGEALEPFQGPSLVFFNDAQFSAEDFKKSRALYKGRKQRAEKQFGRRGIGFRGIYNFSDAPAILPRRG